MPTSAVGKAVTEIGYGLNGGCQKLMRLLADQKLAE